jgi:hypothetical protein
VATSLAMVFNFFVNNFPTYRDSAALVLWQMSV